MTWFIDLSSAGTNVDQKPTATISGPTDPRTAGLKIGDIFHVDGQPEDVQWKVEKIFKEEWRPIPHIPLLEASTLGRIRSWPYELKLPSGGVCTRQMQPTFGYITNSKSKNYPRRQVNFRRKSYMVSRLICITFHGPPPFNGAEAMHKDENSLNNRADNLEWGSRKENANAPEYLKYCRETGVRNLRGSSCAT